MIIWFEAVVEHGMYTLGKYVCVQTRNVVGQPDGVVSLLAIYSNLRHDTWEDRHFVSLPLKCVFVCDTHIYTADTDTQFPERGFVGHTEASHSHTLANAQPSKTHIFSGRGWRVA